MPTQASTLRKQYAIAFAKYIAAFPDIQPPDPSWWQFWFKDNDYRDILEAIQTLQKYPPHIRARYSTESTGKAISAILKEIALRRAIPLSTPPSSDPGAQS